MWAYSNIYTGVDEITLFNTKEEAMEFIFLATQHNMEKYPNDPEMWNMLREEGFLFEITPMTAQEAFKDWFGE